MKTVMLAGIAAIALVSGAQAADLGAVRMSVPAAVLAPAFNWTGFYAGGHLGYGWGRTGWTLQNGGTPVPSDPKGIFGGVQAGYNWQFGANGLIGVETDLSLADLRDREPCPNPSYSCFSRVNWLGTARVRAGFVVDKALFYATGGLAYGSATLGGALGPGIVLGVSTTQTRVGFALGAGVEYAFAPNWSARLEYLYYNLGSSRYQVSTSPEFARATVQAHTVRIGVNYLFTTGPQAVVARY